MPRRHQQATCSGLDTPECATQGEHCSMRIAGCMLNDGHRRMGTARINAPRLCRPLYRRRCGIPLRLRQVFSNTHRSKCFCSDQSEKIAFSAGQLITQPIRGDIINRGEIGGTNSRVCCCICAVCPEHATHYRLDVLVGHGLLNCHWLFL